MGMLTLCNRVMWGLLASVVVAYIAGHAWLAQMAQDDQPTVPIHVPKAAVGRVPPPAVRVIPKPELFALPKNPEKNLANAVPVAPGKTANRPRADAVHGILRFDQFAGAFTKKGFVSEGGDYEGARIKTIAPDGIDFLLGPNSEMRLPLEAKKEVALPATGELRVMELK